MMYTITTHIQYLCMVLMISTLVPFVDVEILILQNDYQDITKEVKKLISIRHRNVMSHFGIGRQMGKVHIFIEFIHGESLNSILKRQGCYCCISTYI